MNFVATEDDIFVYFWNTCCSTTPIGSMHFTKKQIEKKNNQAIITINQLHCKIINNTASLAVQMTN